MPLGAPRCAACSGFISVSYNGARVQRRVHDSLRVVGGSAVELRACRYGSRSLEATRVFDGELITRTAASTTWATAAIACPDGICPMRLRTDADSIVIVNGPANARHGDQTRPRGWRHRAFREGGTSAVASALTGTYNFVGVDPAEGLRGFGDSSGLFPLYWSEGPDACVISNRSSTVAAVLGCPGWNPHDWRGSLGVRISSARISRFRASSTFPADERPRRAGVRNDPSREVSRVGLAEPSTAERVKT